MRTLEKKKNAAEIMQEFYLYPSCSKRESASRIVVWMFSGLFGLLIPDALSVQAQGEFYFVLALSLLADLLFEERKKRSTIFFYGLFSVLLVFTVLGALVLIIKAPPVENTKPQWFYVLASTGVPWVGRVLFIIMLINLVCVLTEVHRFIYDEKAAIEREEEEAQKAIVAEQTAQCAGFTDNLHGPSRGGESQ